MGGKIDSAIRRNFIITLLLQLDENDEFIRIRIHPQLSVWCWWWWWWDEVSQRGRYPLLVEIELLDGIRGGRMVLIKRQGSRCLCWWCGAEIKQPPCLCSPISYSIIAIIYYRIKISPFNGLPLEAKRKKKAAMLWKMDGGRLLKVLLLHFHSR